MSSIFVPLTSRAGSPPPAVTRSKLSPRVAFAGVAKITDTAVTSGTALYCSLNIAEQATRENWLEVATINLSIAIGILLTATLGKFFAQTYMGYDRTKQPLP